MRFLFFLLPSVALAQGLPIKSGASSDLAGVTATNQLQVVTPTTPSQAGYVRLTDGSHNVVFDDEGRIDAALSTFLFNDPVDGAAVNTNKWISSQSTMTQTQASGFITLNATAIITINTYSILTSIQQHGLQYGAYVHWSANVLTPNVPQVNATMEIGLGTAATTAAPTDGAFFRWTSAGEFRAVINNAGTEITSGALTAPTANVVHHFEIRAQHGEADFFVDGVEVATLEPGAGTANITNSARLPIFFRVYAAGVAPATAPQLKIASVDVWRTTLNLVKDWKDVRALMAQGSYQSPITTFVQTANHANSTSPTSATLSNTAAGYTTLGGRYQFAAPVGAATDFALFGYAVPAGHQLVISGVTISSCNTGAAVATTATLLDWGVGLNASAVSLATSDSPPTTWAPRRIPLGMRGFVVANADGTCVPDVVGAFDPPLVVDGGRYFHVILQVPVGTATASQVIRGDVTVSGYFE